MHKLMALQQHLRDAENKPKITVDLEGSARPSVRIPQVPARIALQKRPRMGPHGVTVK